MLHGGQAMPIELLAEVIAGARPLRPRRGAPTRRHIISVARRLFAERSFASTGLDAIAAEAGLSRRSLYNHFTDKQEALPRGDRKGAVSRSPASSRFSRLAGRAPIPPCSGFSDNFSSCWRASCT